MVQADASRNYYADLGVSATADENEIRKAFRQLALKYHPDRNPGREADFVAKFQQIQAAHEILSDSTQRIKYDQERRKFRGLNIPPYNPNAARARPPPPQRAAYGATTTPSGSYYRGPPPPRPPPQRPPPPQHHPTYTNGADRFTSKNFRAPPTAQQPNKKAHDAFTAWQKMKPNKAEEQRPQPQPQPTAPPNNSYNPNGTPFGRTKTARPPPSPFKKGFDPGTPGADEGQARSSYRSNYERPVPPPPPPPPPPADPLRNFKQQMEDSIPDVPFSEANRIRTPYASAKPGERTSMFEGIGRSASVRNSPTNHSSKATDNGAFPGATRGQRNSYGGNGSKFSFQHMYDSSSDEGSEADVFKSSTSSRQSVPPPPPGPPPPPRNKPGTNMFEPVAKPPPSNLKPEPTPNFKSRSEESINVKFSPSNWHGQFVGSADYFAPNIQKGATTKGRTSPTRGRSAQRATSDRPFGGQSQPPPPVSPFSQPPHKTTMPPPPPPPLNTQATFPSETSSAPHSAVFTQDKWKETFKTPQWATFNPGKETSPKRASGNTTKRPKAASRKPSAATNGTSGETATEGPRAKFQAYAADGDAMDIDPATPPEEKSKPPSSGTDHRFKPGTPIKFSSTAHTAPSSPKSPKANRSRAGTMPSGTASAPNSAEEQRSTSGLDGLGGLRNVEPFMPTTNGGLSGLGDLGDSLPFKSKPSSSHPTKPNTAQRLKYPSVPGAPQPPAVLDEASTKAYLAKMEHYVKSYRIYTRTMSAHFAARDAELDALDEHFISQRGETTKKFGFTSYMRKMKEDEEVMETWKVAQELHLASMKKCEEVRNRTMKSYAQ